MKRITVDIGGTFTDIVYIDDSSMQTIVDKVRGNKISKKYVGMLSMATFQLKVPGGIME